MTTPMSGGLILAAEIWSPRELLASGWTDADLAWEQAAERAVEAVAQNDITRAKEEAGMALRLARENFEALDPRLGTALANFAVCLSLADDTEGTARLLDEARGIWRGADPWIARMDAPRIARSSLFHMRMEARHRETYRARWQIRWAEIAAEAKQRLQELKAGDTASGADAAVTLVRFRRERPAMLNDTRKLMAAAFLLLVPAAPDSAD
jgi:hypothetical protein